MTVSEALAAKYVPFIPASKLRTVYQSVTIPAGGAGNGAAGRALLSVAPACSAQRVFRIVIVGEAKETKGQADAVRATAGLVSQGIHAELPVIGDLARPCGWDLQAIAHGLGIAERVHLLECLANPHPLLRTAHVALICSRCEAVGRVTVEAMLAGKPVVGVRAGATPELVRDGLNGLLYAPDDYQELARHLHFLFTHLDAAHQVGANGHRWAAGRFTTERCGAEVACVFHVAVAGRAGDAGGADG